MDEREEDFRRIAGILEKSQQKITQLVAPTTVTGRARFGLTQMFPFLKGMLEVSPMECIRAELRSVLIDLTNDLPALVANGDKRVASHKELMDLYKEAKANTEVWDLTLQLDHRLQQEAMQDEALQVKPETQELLDKILKVDDPEVKEEEQRRIFTSAQDRLNLTEPIVMVTEASIKATVMLRDSMMRQYSTILNISPDLDLMHKNSGALLEGVLAGRNSPKVVTAILEQAIRTIDLVIKTNTLGHQFDQTTDLSKLKQIGEEATKLLEGVDNGGAKRD